eukprot:263162-Chlamydomonas_euryale.AAC.1
MAMAGWHVPMRVLFQQACMAMEGWYLPMRGLKSLQNLAGGLKLVMCDLWLVASWYEVLKLVLCGLWHVLCGERRAGV